MVFQQMKNTLQLLKKQKLKVIQEKSSKEVFQKQSLLAKYLK